MTKGGKTFAYNYGADGVRTQKTVDGVTTEYYTVGGKLLAEKTGDQVLTFHYDEKGTPYALELNGTRYYYRYSLQGDVIGLYSTTGAVVAEYTYDPWGKLLSVTDTSGTDIGTINPLRYRGYYYDTETGFYFLQSRYYDPTVGRFINADGQLSGVGGDMQGYNLFAYCQNDPVNMSDPDGKEAIGFLGALLWKLAGYVAGALVVTALCYIVATPAGQDVIGGLGRTVGKTYDRVTEGIAQIKRGLRNNTKTGSSTKDIAPSIPKGPARDPVHHIVAKAAPDAAEAREILRGVGIDSWTDPRNLVVLPQKYHVSLHTRAYYAYVNSRLRAVAGDRAGVETTLASLKLELIARSAENIRWD